MSEPASSDYGWQFDSLGSKDDQHQRLTTTEAEATAKKTSSDQLFLSSSIDGFDDEDFAPTGSLGAEAAVSIPPRSPCTTFTQPLLELLTYKTEYRASMDERPYYASCAIETAEHLDPTGLLQRALAFHAFSCCSCYWGFLQQRPRSSATRTRRCGASPRWR